MLLKVILCSLHCNEKILYL